MSPLGSGAGVEKRRQTPGLPGGQLALQQPGSLQLPAQVTLALLFFSCDTLVCRAGADPGADDMPGSRAVPPFP